MTTKEQEQVLAVVDRLVAQNDEYRNILAEVEVWAGFGLKYPKAQPLKAIYDRVRSRP